LRPDAWIFLTTSNEAAYQMARQQETVADALCRMPVDAGPVVRRALDRARPDAVAIVECEIWPNFILEAARRATLFMINARIYERDYPRYRAAGWFFRPIIEQVALIGAQTSADAERFLGLGVRRRRVQVIGNTKFDSVRVPKSGSSAKLSRSDLRLKDGPLWVLASTHPGEESAILEALAVRDFVAIRLVIAPRDIRRADEIAQACSWRGWHVARRTKPGEKPVDVMILDTLGELVDVLPLADLVFVGGSLVDRGGHNPIEPAAWGKPIVMGPSVYNFADVVDTFRDADALEICANAQELVDRAIELMNQVDRRRRLGERSQRVVASRRGAALVYAALLVDPAWQRRAA
jgi:3-deoxy-D-manno-octulosonic-acid transferase